MVVGVKTELKIFGKKLETKTTIEIEDSETEKNTNTH